MDTIYTDQTGHWDQLEASLVGVTHTCEQHSSTNRMLCQSTFQSNAAVALLESAIIPPRTEMILEGKLAKTANSKMGMIEPRSCITTDARQCWTFTVDINILVIFARTGETGNRGKGYENRCRTRDFRDRVYTCYEFILCELYYKK